MLKFKEVRWKNFLSYGNYFTNISLERNATTLVVGKNGSGKSTISDAISFVLYNKPFRKIKKESLINSINRKDCVVEIEFDNNKDSYKVVRGIKPNLFEIYKNGELLNQEASNKDYQEFLEKQILKINFKTFTQIVILGSSSFVPFMRLTTPQRREVIEDLLDIQIFTSMSSVLKSRIKNLGQILQENKHSIALKEKDKEHQIAIIEKEKENIQEKIEEYIQECKDLSQQITENTKKIEEQKKCLTNILEMGIIDTLETKTKEQDDLSKQIWDDDSQIREGTKLVTFYSNHESCPTCTQEIDVEFKENIISTHEAEIKRLNSNREKLVERLSSTKTEIANLKESMREAQEINNKVTSLETILSSQKLSLGKRVKDIERLKKRNQEKSSTDEKKKLEAIKKEIDESSEAMYTNEDDHTLHKVLESFLTKDSGIKAEIIKRYLPVMNKTIESYLDKMDFFVKFEIDENFDETIKSRHRDKFTYASFSEGEKQKIDIALLFTWREIAKLRNSINTNLLILDEIADSSLDENSTSELIKILKFQKGLNIFLISHKSGGDAGYDGFRSVLSVEKKNNFSRVN